MKKVLHRGFKPAKCKIALQMASSRLKILKNKKDIQIKQLRRELAKLLEAGQDQTARIRVEHVVREEKTMAAYELVGIYCELLVARLAVIDSQKNCPIDLKEAVASVLFASQRCADVPELSDVVKHFTAKYGKDFASAAIELRPDCGVSRLLVEKLSVKAPDGPTKVKILAEIAEEHNIKWEPKSFGEPDPKAIEVLGGPSSFESASRIHVDSPRVPEKEPSNFPAPPVVNVPHGSSVRNNVPVNSYAHDRRSSSHAQSVARPDVNLNETSDSYHSNARHSGTSTDAGEHKHPYSGDGNSSPMSRRTWELEFEDATAAARAAAESAERASIAARAAAELSSKERMTRQNSTESQKSSSSYNSRHEPPLRHGSSKLQSQHFTEDHPSPRRNSRMQYEDMGGTRQDSTSGNLRKDSVQKNDKSRTETSTSSNDNESEYAQHWGGRHSRDSSSEMRQSDVFGKSCGKKQPSEPDVDIGYSEEVQLSRQSSRASSRSHSRTYSDEHVVGSDYVKSVSVLEENVFATDDKDQRQSSAKETDSHDDGHDDDSAAFDDYSSFFDKPQFDVEDAHDEPVYGLGFSLLGGKSPAHTSTNANAWSFTEDRDQSLGKHNSSSHIPEEKHASPVFDDVSTSPAVLGKRNSSSHIPEEKHTSPVFDDVSTSPAVPLHVQESSVKYDDYSPDSESEEEPSNKAKVSGSKSVRERLDPTSHPSPRFQVSDEVEHDFFPSDTDEPVYDSRRPEESNVETQTGLKFGALTGGLRNKKTLPPYTMSPARDAASSKPEEQYTSTNVDQSFSSSAVTPSVSPRISRKELYNEKVSNTDRGPSSTPPESSSSDDGSEEELQGRAEQDKRSDSKTRVSDLHSRITDDDSEKKLPKRAPTRGQERQNKQMGTKDHKRANVKTPAPYLLSPSSDDEEEKVDRNATNVNTRPSIRLSRRTKAQPKPPEKSSFTVPNPNNNEDDRRSRTKPKPESHDQHSSKPLSSESKSSTSGPLPKIATSARTENAGASNVETPSKDKASHVHPKLPDYDNILATFGPLRSNRR